MQTTYKKTSYDDTDDNHNDDHDNYNDDDDDDDDDASISRINFKNLRTLKKQKTT